jgi:hypothetical protein
VASHLLSLLLSQGLPYYLFPYTFPPKHTERSIRTTLSNLLRATMLAETSPEDYAWHFSTQDYRDVLWKASQCRPFVSPMGGSPSKLDVRSLRYTVSTRFIRYDLVISEENPKNAFLDRYRVKSFPDFMINISVTPIAGFKVAKKAACEVAARSIPLPEDYRCWFWGQCQVWSQTFRNRIEAWGDPSKLSRLPVSCSGFTNYALSAEMNMCEFLMRYCGKVMAREFMQTATRPWTVFT